MVYSLRQLSTLMCLRMLLSWGMLYEGLHSVGYAPDSDTGAAVPFSAADFSWTATDLLQLSFFIAPWLLMSLGGALMLGLLEKWTTSLGAVFLLLQFGIQLYANGLGVGAPARLLADPRLFEAAALATLFVFPTSRVAGLDLWLAAIELPRMKDRRPMAGGEAA